MTAAGEPPEVQRGETEHCGCSCTEPRNAPSRRSFLKGVSAAAAHCRPPRRALVAARLRRDPTYAGDVLVVLSLRGGVDGLSVVPPVGDPNYAALRPTLSVPGSLALPLGGIFGFHPALAPLKPLYDSKRLAVIHAVGQPSGTRSHFRDTEELERAAPGTSLRTGWLDRVLGVRGTGTSFQAVQLGSAMVPGSLAGPAPVLGMPSVDEFQLQASSVYRTQAMTALGAMHAGVAHPVAQNVGTTLAALNTTASMKAAGYSPTGGAVYPSSKLGTSLRDLARIIKRGLGLQIATIDYGNWDMHTGLGRPGDAKGWLHTQLSDVANCLAAFSKDLGSGLSNVTVVTLTEFGRRAAENGDGGVDHGHGQAVLMLGGGTRGGQVFGRWPGLGPTQLDSGDLAGTTDYRNLLGEVLQKRCGVGNLAPIFPGLQFAPVGLVLGR